MARPDPGALLGSPASLEENDTVTQALERARSPYELLEFADEGHGISKPANKKTLYLRLQQLFKRAFEVQGKRL